MRDDIKRLLVHDNFNIMLFWINLCRIYGENLDREIIEQHIDHIYRAVWVECSDHSSDLEKLVLLSYIIFHRNSSNITEKAQGLSNIVELGQSGLEQLAIIYVEVTRKLNITPIYYKKGKIIYSVDKEQFFSVDLKHNGSILKELFIMQKELSQRELDSSIALDLIELYQLRKSL